MSLDLLQIQPVHIAILVSMVVFIFFMLVAGALQYRGRIRRRIGTIETVGLQTGGISAARERDQKWIKKILARSETLLNSGSNEKTQALRRQMVQAGYFSPNAVAIYYVVRGLMGVGLAIAVPALVAIFQLGVPANLVPVIAAGSGAVGIIFPSVFLDWRRSRMRTNYENAFPDFMDLLVVCIESGQSLPGAIDRVSKEIVEFNPAFGANLHIANLEMRAGRTLTECLDGLHDRIGIDDVKSLQLLLRQSEKLGTSIAGTLRIYSDDMRDKRLMRAEAKALALPVKMTVPLGLFLFPVVLGVIMLPIVIRIIRVMG